MDKQIEEFLKKFREMQQGNAREAAEQEVRADPDVANVEYLTGYCVCFTEVMHEEVIPGSETIEDSCFTPGCTCKRWKVRVANRDCMSCQFKFRITFTNPERRPETRWVRTIHCYGTTAWVTADRVLEICPPEIIEKREREWRKRMEELEREEESRDTGKRYASIISIPASAVDGAGVGQTLFLSDGEQKPVAFFKLRKRHGAWVSTEAVSMLDGRLEIAVVG